MFIRASSSNPGMTPSIAAINCCGSGEGGGGGTREVNETSRTDTGSNVSPGVPTLCKAGSLTG